MKDLRCLFTVCCIVLFALPVKSFAQKRTLPQSLKVGVSLSITAMTAKKMEEAKSAGISCVQLSVNEWFDKKTGHFKVSDKKMKEEVKNARKVAKASGIKIWAIHMPFGRYIDISLIDEKERNRVVALHKKVLSLCRILKPKVILFHPSWFLSLNQRKEHINQLIRSVLELQKPVTEMGAIIVIENMTGPKLYVKSHGVKYERPLCRTVSETMAIMDKLPPDIYAAVDLNHILHPEQLILAVGHRLRFIHVSDGDGAHERHYFPCSGKGMNDWMAILAALYKVGYTGPFMYECHYKGFNDLTVCYNYMYNKFILDNNIKEKYQK